MNPLSFLKYWSEYPQVAVAVAGLERLLSIDGQLVRRAVLVCVIFSGILPFVKRFTRKIQDHLMSKVSILIPAYNAERFVGAALQSALDQTWPDTEIIVVDDGSKDQTYAVAKRYESAKVKILRQGNRGAAAARNAALRQAQGDFLQYLDADDLLSPDKIREQVLLLQQHPGYVSVSSAMYFFDGEDPKAGLLERSGALDSDHPVEFLAQLLGSEGPTRTIPYGAWLTPRAVAEAAGSWDDTVRSPDDDGEYFSRVMLASKGVRASHEGCYFYRKFRQGGSYSSTYSETIFADGCTRSTARVHTCWRVRRMRKPIERSPTVTWTWHSAPIPTSLRSPTKHCAKPARWAARTTFHPWEHGRATH